METLFLRPCVERSRIGVQEVPGTAFVDTDAEQAQLVYFRDVRSKSASLRVLVMKLPLLDVRASNSRVVNVCGFSAAIITRL